MQALLSWIDRPLFVIRLVTYMVDQSTSTLDTCEAEKTEISQKTKGIDAPNVRTMEDPLPTAAKEQFLQHAEVEEGGFRAWTTVLGALVVFSSGQYPRNPLSISMLLQSAGFGYVYKSEVLASQFNMFVKDIPIRSVYTKVTHFTFIPLVLDSVDISSAFHRLLHSCLYHKFHLFFHSVSMRDVSTISNAVMTHLLADG